MYALTDAADVPKAPADRQRWAAHPSTAKRDKVSGRRIETATSRTAEWTCLSRAASSLESDSHYRSDDYIALLLVPTFFKLILHIPLVRRFFTQVLSPKGIYEYTIARTKYIDAVFKETLAEGFDQILVFGAGFDTRALRFQAEAEDTKIFELDVPITQKAKLGQYAKRGLSIPANVAFISIDFDKESLSEKLEEAGFDKNGRSLFVLEGLLMYLQQESVDETFKVIEKFAGKGSEVVFDYVRAPVLRQAGLYYGERDIMKSVAKADERWSFGIEDGELEGFLKKYGLRVSEHKDAQDLERMYFTDASGEIVGRVNGTHCLVRAEKL
jgi:methyltransferase (TIGR00027 family)